MRMVRSMAPMSAPQALILAVAGSSSLLLLASSASAQQGQAPAAPPAEAEPVAEVAEEPAAETAPVESAEETAPSSQDEADAEEAEEEPAAASGAGSSAAGASGGGEFNGDAAGLGFGAYPNPADDQKALEDQGKKRPADVQPDRVFAEEWWAHTRPTVEFHGNFRVRANLYHNFHFNRIDTPESALWPRPLDDAYTDLNGTPHGAYLCTPDEAGTGSSDEISDATVGCHSPTQGGADIRFRIEPAIIISDNLRVHSQIDLLSNLVMGSTAQGNMNYPAASGGYYVGSSSGYYPISGVTDSQGSPVSGVNSLQDAVSVRRAWAEYDTPVGQLKFGRMPDNWGLGMVYNAGDDLDGDYQSTVDRIAFTTGLPSWALYLAGAWDFTNEGATSQAFTAPGGPAYDLSQRDDVSRINLQMYRRLDPQLEKLELAKGKIVVNGGMYLNYRWQRLANDSSGTSATCAQGADALDCQPGEAADGLVRRNFKMWTPDVFWELKYKGFSTGFEVVTHQGQFYYPDQTTATNSNANTKWKIRQWGFAGEIKQKLIEDRLLLGFYYGYATGDGDVDTLVPPSGGLQPQYGDHTISTFRFHPGYRVDLILNRHVLSRVQGSYYFKPMAQYDFIRKASGLKLGGRAEAIWTRASNFMQTPGHQRDLGIELDASVYYQSKDGSLNTNNDLTGGFFAQMQYGIAFPLGGMTYLSQQAPDNISSSELKLKPAQMVRGFLGVAF